MICTIVFNGNLLDAKKECESRKVKVVRVHALFNNKSTLIIDSDALTLNEWFTEAHYGVPPPNCLLWWREGD